MNDRILCHQMIRFFYWFCQFVLQRICFCLTSILKRLKILGASRKQLIGVYVKQIQSILEYFSLTLEDRLHIERVQRAALQVIFGSEYTSYTSACEQADLCTLESRRVKLCQKFERTSSGIDDHSVQLKTKVLSSFRC